MDFQLISKIESFIKKFDGSSFIINYDKAENLSSQRPDGKNILHELSQSINVYKTSKVFSAAGAPNQLAAQACSNWIFEAILNGVLVEKHSIKQKVYSGYKMFISSTMEDLEEERQKIANEVTRSRNVPIMAEYTIDVIHTPREAIEKLVDSCDAYICVFHKKWGFVPEKNNPERSTMCLIYKCNDFFICEYGFPYYQTFGW